MNVEKQYIDLFCREEATIREHSPQMMNSLRTNAFEYFRQNGFPSITHENYKYTNVKEAFLPDYGLNLNRIHIPVEPYEVLRCDVPNLSTSLYFMINDSFYSKKLPNVSLPEGVYIGGIKDFAIRSPDVLSRYYGKAATWHNDAIVALNTMFVQDGFVLYIPEGVKLKRPVQLVNIFRSDVDLMANRRVLVIMEPHSEAKLLVCDHSMDGVKFLGTEVVEVFAEEGAFFDYYNLEESTIQTTRFSSVFVRQAAFSNVLLDGITLNNGLTRNNYYINLSGERAETTLCGMAIEDRYQHVDTFSHIVHEVPHCTSTELFKNVLDEQSIGVFSGRILVEKNAQKTMAYQTNRNMCLTRDAHMFSKPQLEIYADDVKCSHGMTTGQLDEQALFYMQSRGLSYEEARLLLSIAFTADVIDYIRLDALKERLQQLVEKRFRGELARCADCGIYK